MRMAWNGDVIELDVEQGLVEYGWLDEKMVKYFELSFLKLNSWVEQMGHEFAIGRYCKM